MKKIYQGILFVAFMLAAIYWLGNAEGGNFFIALLAVCAIGVLMAKSGMLAKPISKEEYYKHYGREM